MSQKLTSKNKSSEYEGFFMCGYIKSKFFLILLELPPAACNTYQLQLIKKMQFVSIFPNLFYFQTTARRGLFSKRADEVMT